LRLRLAAAALLAASAASPALAQFAAFVLPARFELTAKPGQKISEVLEIGNDDSQPADFRLRTADWMLRADGSVDFRTDTLENNSCRPWVRLERHTLKLGPKAKRRFRFEIEIPGDAPSGLCRFALLIEPGNDPLVMAPLGNIQLPVQGRIGVIVYVRIGDAKPLITLEGMSVAAVNGRPTPVARFRNDGNAQGRPDGILAGTDAQGRTLDFVAGPLPILPGETRAIPFWPQDGSDGKPAEVAYPVKLKGTIEWEGGRQAVDTTLK
jgi:fimbrial chaperone protein